MDLGMAQPSIYKNREITVYNNGVIDHIEDAVVQEKPLTLFLNHVELATMVCSPGGYKELGVGFLLSEGLVQKPSDILEISIQEEEGQLWIETSSAVPQTSNILRSTSAGSCRKSRAELHYINDARQLQLIESDAQFTADHLLKMINSLEDRSSTFKLTGGVHNAALADSTGLLTMYEDIGRHNAVDKVLGYAFINGIFTNDKCLLLSGRIASEILIKAARANIPLVLSRSAPTGLTIELADEMNITVVGFARGKRFSIYSHPERVLM
ncbi:MAG: formate dehydrogenase accessory sulfurtransferase FdhD [Syntrophomonas sp.]|nr:formate dehydrogenase accessory sulfurtransferase FdhD [Syntrophomonas sp.]